MRKKILICDDDEGILKLLEIILRSHGYKAIPEKESLNIFRAIENEQPDLVLLDLWMPELSGEQVVKALRQNDHTKHLPVIIISASTEGDKIAHESGADEYLAKPFDVNQLVDKIKVLI